MWRFHIFQRRLLQRTSQRRFQYGSAMAVPRTLPAHAGCRGTLFGFAGLGVAVSADLYQSSAESFLRLPRNPFLQPVPLDVSAAESLSLKAATDTKAEEELKADDSLVVDYAFGCYNMGFKQHSGPNGIGRLIITPAGPGAVTGTDTASFLRDLDDLAAKQLEIEGDFVCIFDISQIVWPSMLSLPSILRTVAKHKLSEPFKQRTVAFAIVCQQGGWFESVIDAIIKIKKAESPPIFACEVKDADRLLNERFGI